MKYVLTAAVAIACSGAIAAADMGPVPISTASGLSAMAPTGERPTHRGVITATYDFASGSLDYYAGSSALNDPIVFDASAGGYRILGVEASDIVATVNWNNGATFENWASELRLGWADAEFGIIGIAPFAGINDGPDIQGTGMEFTGGGFAFLDTDGTIDINGDGNMDDFFMPSEGAAVGAFSTYNDGSGLAAGTITGGTITFTLEIPTPGSAMLAGLAGLAAMRRHR
ncbi:MAG: hypothetical protein ACNA8P_00580 [Phycisphaerales bacterium]